MTNGITKVKPVKEILFMKFGLSEKNKPYVKKNGLIIDYNSQLTQ